MHIALMGHGKMGRALEALLSQEENDHCAGFYTAFGPPEGRIDVLVDFSHPGNLERVLGAAAAQKLPLVIGTTGYDIAQKQAIREAAQNLPIVQAENFSIGMAVLRRLAAEAAQILDGAFDIEIVEMHHGQKADTPSGTARALLERIDPEGRYKIVCGRDSEGPRGQEIGVHAVRGGTAAGVHSVLFFGQQEELELRHRADSREIFARGALKAAAFVLHAPPGLYSMEDVLFGGKQDG